MTRIGFPVWPGLLWGLALLGLLLLPTDYRAGAETAHAHSLMQLWVDAADGSIHHHHPVAAPGTNESMSWFDPELGGNGSARHPEMGVTHPDVGEQHDSAPVTSGFHFLIDTLTTVVIVAVGRAPLAVSGRQPESLFPRVLLPPPRWTPSAV